MVTGLNVAAKSLSIDLQNVCKVPMNWMLAKLIANLFSASSTITDEDEHMNDLKIREEYLVKDEDKLRDICGHTAESIWAKATTVITEPMQQFIAMSPFCCLSSQNSEHQTDLSPRGDPAGFVTVANESTLLMPDRPGNRRYDTMRNVVQSPQVSLLFMIPGISITLRVNGTAQITHDPEILEPFVIRNKLPQLVLIINVEEAYGHCAKAILRSKLWDPKAQPSPEDVPTLADLMMHHRKLAKDEIERIDETINDDIKNSMY